MSLSQKYDVCAEISKISMLFSHISYTPQPPIQCLLLQTFRSFSDDSSFVKSFWIEGWGNRKIDDDKCAKMQFLTISENWTNIYACCSFNSIIYNDCSVYIDSLDFPLIIYVTKIKQFHVSQFWHGTAWANFAVRGPSSLHKWRVAPFSKNLGLTFNWWGSCPQNYVNTN